MVAVHPVGQAVVENGVNAGVQQKDLQLAAGRGVAALVRGQQAAQSGDALCHIVFAPFITKSEFCRSGTAARHRRHRQGSEKSVIWVFITRSSIGKTKTPPAPIRAQEAYSHAVPLLHSLMPAQQPDSPITAASPGAITPRAPGCTSQLPPWARLQPVARPLCPLDELLLFPFLTHFGLPQYITRNRPPCQD